MSNWITQEVEKTLCILGEEIKDRQYQIEFIKSIDFTKPIDEETWHKICETPMRNSNALSVLVKNTFPLAKNIVVHCNYVYFEMSGFSIQIPTSRTDGINVNLNWYKKDGGVPYVVYHNMETYQTKKYFDAVDRNAGWYELAKLRLKGNNKVYLFFAWWFRYKWKKVDRKYCEKIFAVDEKNFETRVKLYHEERKLMKTKAKLLVETILPIIDTFSTVHRPYNNYDNMSSITIENLRKYENI